MDTMAETKVFKVRQAVTEARQHLSELNLLLAQFRVAHGMTVGMTILYRAMGKADGALVEAEKACCLKQTVYEVGGLWDYLEALHE